MTTTQDTSQANVPEPKMPDDGICTATRDVVIGYTQVTLKCDLYALHSTRHRSFFQDGMIIYWDART